MNKLRAVVARSLLVAALGTAVAGWAQEAAVAKGEQAEAETRSEERNMERSQRQEELALRREARLAAQEERLAAQEERRAAQEERRSGDREARRAERELALEEKELLRAKLDAARAELTAAARRLARAQREFVEESERFGHWQVHTEQDGESINIVINPGRDVEFHSIDDTPPKLGLLINSRDGGTRVVGMTPGGGAQRAGLRIGDLVLSVAGSDVSGDTTIAEALHGTQAGDSVPVTVGRDGKTLTFAVQTSAPERELRVFTERYMPDIDVDLSDLHDELENMQREIARMHEATPRPAVPPVAAVPPVEPVAPRLPGLSILGGDTDLVSNHPGLAPYFGTGEGILVLRIEASNPLALRDGDVILRIDDETLSSPVDLGRALLGREPGESVVLAILRHGDPLQLEGRVPEPNMPAALGGGHPRHPAPGESRSAAAAVRNSEHPLALMVAI